MEFAIPGIGIVFCRTQIRVVTTICVGGEGVGVLAWCQHTPISQCVPCTIAVAHGVRHQM